MAGVPFQRLLRQLEEQHARDLEALRKRLEVSAADAPNSGTSIQAVSSSLLPNSGTSIQAVSSSLHGGKQAPVVQTGGCTGTLLTDATASAPSRLGDQRFSPKRSCDSTLSSSNEIHHEQTTNLMSNAVIYKKVSALTFTAAQKEQGWQRFLWYAEGKGWKGLVDHNSQRCRSQSRLQQLIYSQSFDALCAAAIILNTALLGASTDFSARTMGKEELPIFYQAMEHVFTVWFLLELVGRWVADGFVRFICLSQQRLWNWFDCFVVGTDLIETSIQIVVGDAGNTLGNVTIMRMLRVLRIARALRIVRLVSFCKELRMMVLSVLKSGMSLFWSMTLLSIIIYIFGIFLMQSVTQTIMEGNLDDDLRDKLLEQFGTLSKTFYQLFLAISGGINWGDLGDPLIEAQWTNGLVLSFYIFFTIFAMMNIITGIFVDTALTSVSNDNDEVIQEEMRSENSAIKQLFTIFNEADVHGQGKINASEFEDLMSKTRPRALMARMGLQVNEARSMFELLDSEKTGFVSIEEFLVGCMRMRGGAKNVDLISLMHENSKLQTHVRRLAGFVKEEFARMDRFEDRVEQRLEGLNDLTELRLSEANTLSMVDRKTEANSLSSVAEGKAEL